MEGHPTEHELELIFIAPGKIDVDLRTQIEDHLQHCDLCWESASLLKSFHDELRQSPQSLAHVEEFLGRIIFSPKIVELRPYRYVPDAAEFGEHAMTVLAAKSEAPREYRYSTVCTLLSRNEDTLVRILKDLQTDKYRIYLITRTPGHAAATVRFPSFDLDVPINPETLQAEFSLPANASGIDWMNIIAELRFS